MTTPTPLVTPRLPATLPDGEPWPKISIVTPSLNQGRFVAETIRSVIDQGYPNVEHIVMDGGSTDGTLSILREYAAALAVVVSEPDSGQSQAINKGMARATGDILTWLNSDDRLPPGALAAAAFAFHTSGAEMIAGACELFSGEQRLGVHLTSCADGPLPLDDLLDLDGGWNAGQFFYQPEVLFRRSVWERAGAHVDESLFYSMDYELWVRFAEAGAALHVIGRPLAQFRVHDDQKTHDPSRFRAELVTCRDAYVRKSGRTLRSRPVPARPRQQLRVALVNDLGFEYGAGLAHQRIAESLALAGHEVVPVSCTTQDTAGVRTVQTSDAVARAVEASEPDAVFVGNLHGAGAESGLIATLAARWPTLCVLHDFWLLTGRCAYPGDCTRYLQGCDASCPTATEYPALEPARIGPAWAGKRALLDRGQPVLLANSDWTAALAREALGASHPIESIRLPCPTDIFRPRDRQAARAALGLPQDRFIVLSTSEFADARKGTAVLFSALRSAALANLLVVSTSYSEPEPGICEGVDLIRLGYLRQPEQLAFAYAAANVMVSASAQETFGQVFIEAAACGVPAIGLPTSGVREAVVNGVTGRLAAAMTAADLAEVIQELHHDPDALGRMGAWARLHAENEYSPMAAYRTLFLAMWRQGIVQRSDMHRKIGFLTVCPPVADPTLPRVAVHASAALCPAEGPVPEHGLGVFQWATGPVTRLELSADEAGSHLVAIKYRSVHQGQRVRLDVNGSPVGDYTLQETGFKKDRWLVCTAMLRRGLNELDLHFTRWYAPHENTRPLALIVTQTFHVPNARPPAVNA